MTENKKLEELVEAFSTEMSVKLLLKSGDGWAGWRDKSRRIQFVNEISAHLMRAALDDDPLQYIDVANYAAFLWSMAGRPKA